jgi:hypothetical protein
VSRVVKSMALIRPPIANPTRCGDGYPAEVAAVHIRRRSAARMSQRIPPRHRVGYDKESLLYRPLAGGNRCRVDPAYLFSAIGRTLLFRNETWP